MNVKPILLFTSILFFTIVFNACQSAEAEKPNVVFILADDLGWADLSCLGQQIFKTPHIDKLAADGMLMTNFYTGSTVCAPSRATIMTGKHTGHNSIRSNQGNPVLKDEEITIAELFKVKGYNTGCIGKWGVGSPTDKNDPKRNGFDYFYGYINAGHAHNLFPEYLYQNGDKVKLTNKIRLNEEGVNPWAHKGEGMGVAEVRNEYAPFLFDGEALRFIERNKDEPFFLYLAYNTPHANNEDKITGCEVPEYGEFKDKDWPEVEKGFAKMVTNLDHSVGLVVNKLEELGLIEKTLIIFCSDNGPHQEGGHIMEYFNSNGDLRGMKRDLYDGGIRTPFIVRWDGVVEPDSRSDHLSAFWDVLPTFCDILEIAYPEKIDGLSFLPALSGKGKQAEHDYLYWEFYEKGGKQALIKGDWKAVRLNLNNGRERIEELYNLDEDPEEQENLAAEYPEMMEGFEMLFEEARTDDYPVSLFSR